MTLQSTDYRHFNEKRQGKIERDIAFRVTNVQTDPLLPLCPIEPGVCIENCRLICSYYMYYIYSSYM